MLLPRVTHIAPGVEAHGFQVDAYSSEFMRVSTADVAIVGVESPWGPVTLAASTGLFQLVLVIAPSLDMVWVIRAPLTEVRLRLKGETPDDWSPPLLPGGMICAR